LKYKNQQKVNRHEKWHKEATKNDGFKLQMHRMEQSWKKEKIDRQRGKKLIKKSNIHFIR
jgi:hypothetical protein